MPDVRSSIFSVAYISHMLVLLGSTAMSFGLMALGVLCIAAPQFSSKMYGLPLAKLSDTGGKSEGIPWVDVVGLRDFCIGVGGLAFFLCQPKALRIYVPVVALVPAGDAVLTISWGGLITGWLTHLFGVVSLGTLAVATWLDPSLDELPKKQALLPL
mmetsp:Transcript_69290/g.123399  ORF Transcript_69290/g.123399 Transcript_69290/m.123399 type:complete len:157 (+) Transcript_69290:84-554(+)